MKIICVIPARYGSSRFPGKPLAKIAGSPMIEWVYRRAKAVPEFDRVIVATDDDRILQAVASFGGDAVMTPAELTSGTDRVAFLAGKIKAGIFVNLQGDEPLVTPEVLKALVEPFSDPDVLMTTPVSRIDDPSDLTDANKARVIIDRKGDALYFSRAAIPVLRDIEDIQKWPESHIFYKHIGIYAYRRSFLMQLARMPISSLEVAEKLEQLRVLENGYRIRTVVTEYKTRSVDTPEDLQRINREVGEKNITMEDSNEN
jgi:3-deoxy-manno-octulosonate cytidylyltransferase (CMP-KDO synthetase)